MVQQLLKQKAGTTNTNISQSIDERTNRSSQEVLRQEVSKVIISPYFIVIWSNMIKKMYKV
jgi:hypothetical protein